MWITNLEEFQFNHIAETMRKNGKGYEWRDGDYSAIKLKIEDIEKFFPHYLKN